MPGILLQPVSGIVDGTNRVYTTAAAFRCGTLQVYLDGVLWWTAAGPAWREFGPDGFVTLAAPPRGSELRAFYFPLR